VIVKVNDTNLFSLIISVPLGALASVIGWWFLFHILSPNLKFSALISKMGDNQYTKYRVRIKNNGRRAAIDLNIIVRLQIQGLVSGNPKMRKQINLTIAGEKIPFISKQKYRIIRILPNKTDTFSDIIYPQNIREKHSQGKLSLEDVMSIGTDNFFQIHIFAFDSFSGSRKMFLSKKYRKEDIMLGAYNGLSHIWKKDNPEHSINF